MMETRVCLQDYLQECENIHFAIEVVDDAADDAPYLMEIRYESETIMVSQWMREKDINMMIKILQKAKRERKELVE